VTRATSAALSPLDANPRSLSAVYKGLADIARRVTDTLVVKLFIGEDEEKEERGMRMRMRRRGRMRRQGGGG
jgi:riboflavin synthase